VLALPRNTHLSKLYLISSNISAEFAHDELLPAVRANTSLRLLIAGGHDGADAEAQVAARAAAGAGGAQ
jgi:hypothetical protein